MMHHPATPATADSTTITATASAFAEAASAAHFSAADATCRHPRPTTAGRWAPSPIAAGVVSTITTGALAATFTAATTANKPAAAQPCWTWRHP